MASKTVKFNNIEQVAFIHDAEKNGQATTAKESPAGMTITHRMWGYPPVWNGNDGKAGADGTPNPQGDVT